MSVLNSSTLQINPDIPEAFKLRGWFDSNGRTAQTVSISGQRTSGEHDIIIVIMVMMISLQEECRHHGCQLHK